MKTPKELALLAARALSDKKGKEIQALEIADLTTLADYFVLATGSPGCCWTTAAWPSMCSAARPGSFTVWSACGGTASPWT